MSQGPAAEGHGRSSSSWCRIRGDDRERRRRRV